MGRWPGARLLRCTVPRPWSGPPFLEQDGGLLASAPNPPMLPRALLLSFSSFFIHLHFPALSLFLVPCTLCSRRPWGCWCCPGKGLCAASRPSSQPQQGHGFRKDPLALFLGRVPCAEPGVLGGLQLTPPGQIPASLGICWVLIPLRGPYFPKLSPCKSFTFLLGVGTAVPSGHSTDGCFEAALPLLPV